MLSKIVGLAAVFALFLTPTTAEAHKRHKKPRVAVSVATPAIQVTLGWKWVNATLFRAGYWHHPHYGKSYRTHVMGPPVARPHNHAVWVPGHWQGRGHHKTWVPGRWINKR